MKKKYFFILRLMVVFLFINQLIYAQKNDVIQSIESKLSTTKVDTSKVNLYYKLADAYMGVDLKLFDENLKKGFALATKINYSKGQSNYYSVLSYKYLVEGNPKQGLALAHKSAALSLSIQDTTGYLKSMYYEAAAYMYLGDINQMKLHVETAIKFLKNKSYYTDRGLLYSLMVQYYSREDLAKSFEYIVLEYDCLKNNKDPKQMFSVYNEFAGYYFTVSDIKESIAFSKKALAEANKIYPNTDYNRALAMSNLANILLYDKQYEKATIYINKSLQLSNKIKNSNLVCKNTLLLAEIKLENKNYEETIKLSNQVLSNIDLPEFYLNANLFIASANNGLKKHKEALQILQSIDDSKIDGFIPTNKIKYYQELSVCNSALANYKDAFNNLQTVNNLQQVFLENKGSLNTIGLQSKFQLREKNYAIEKLKLDNQKEELKHQKQKTQNKLLIGSSILLVILIVLLVWAYQFRKRGNFIFGLSRVQLQNEIQEKEMLVKEIHHRVKNNFQLISSMMRIQATDTSIDVEEFVKLTTSRIISLSNIHEKLYLKDNFYQLNANEYVKEIAEYSKSSFSDADLKIEYEFSDAIVFFDLETMMPLGLIINELLTNTYKYAFKGKSEGKIVIKIEQLSKSKFQLIYSDNGVGFNEKDHFSKNVGMSLIEALSKQLRSNPKMNFENGAYFEIVFNKIIK